MGSIVTLLRRQAAYSAALGSPLTATVLGEIITDYQRNGPCRELIASFAATSSGMGMLGFRIAGALHYLVLSGLAPDLAAFYPTAGGVFSERGFWPEVLAAMLSHWKLVGGFMGSPPQTNEIGRAGSLLAGFLTVAREARLPLRCLEAGASAGLLLHWDRYQYDLGDRRWGDPASRVLIRNRWLNAPRGLPARDDISVAERRGCDLDPVNLEDADARMRLRSFIWGDHPTRLARLDGAIALASSHPASVDHCGADSWIEGQLAAPRPGVATVLYTSFSALYFDEGTRAQIRETLGRAAAAATPEAPLALMQLEGNGPDKPPQLELYQWPGGNHRVLATADILGLSTGWVNVQAPCNR